MPENRRLGANSLLLSLGDGVVDMQSNIWQHLYEFGAFLGDAQEVLRQVNHPRPFVGVSQKSLFKRPCQVLAINANKMAPRTG